jgi:ADP-dependent phosphofructokinase/glucokinase
VPLTDSDAVAEALKLLEKLIPVPVLMLHTRYWALAYGEGAARYKNALLGGVAMATSRFLLGDDFTKENYKQTFHLPAEKEGAIFALKLQALLKDKVCCVPSLQVLETKVTTIGLGDSFVGGVIPALL